MNMIRLALLWLAALHLAPAAAQTLPGRGWVTSWASSQMVPDDQQALPDAELAGATLRQLVRLSAGGERLRIRVSNRFGTAPLELGPVHVALAAAADSPRIEPGSDRAVTFGGDATIAIPAGAEYVSDPVALKVPPLRHLAVSIYFPEAPERQTGHPGSRATSYLLKGDHVAAADLPGAGTADRWYQLSGIDVLANEDAGAVVVLGDSITDGYGVRPNTDQRWTDTLALRLQESDTRLAVVNQGIGGNRLLLDGLGPNALARFERDVLGQRGVEHLIVLIGVNDLGTFTRDAPQPPEAHRALVERMIAGYQQIVARARAHGVQAIGATILPFGGSDYYHPDAATEADRQTINAWIREPGNFDAVIDFDARMRDPERPTHLRPEYDSGDGLHPSMAGYKAMGEAVPLSLFAKGPEIALTFDDLPEHGPLPDGISAEEVSDAILDALQAKGVEHAMGFVNAAKVEQNPARMEILQAWRDAGYPLANHGWSHRNLDVLTPEEFAAEVAGNEPLLRKLMPEGGWRWFRYPFLAEGDDPAKRAAARAVLGERGYRIAPVTMDFGDWRWNGAYARCAAKGDTAAIERLETLFLAAAGTTLDAHRAQAHRLYGRDIPYVLLLHVGAFDARMMPRLIDLYRREGVRFVPLETAMRDPVYARANAPAATDPPGVAGAMLSAVGGPEAARLARMVETMCS